MRDRVAGETVIAS